MTIKEDRTKHKPTAKLKGEKIMQTNKVSFVEILIEYYNRQYNFRHPIGGVNNKGEWLPAKQEHRECCDVIINNKSKDPLKLYSHCCTLAHLSELYNVDLEKLILYKNKLKEISGNK